VLERLDTPPGVVRGATARPDGTVELAWSSSQLPPVIRRADGPVVLSVGSEEPPEAYPVEDRWVPGPGGDVHALLVRPEGRPAPYATAFLVHGGPEAADDDSYRARRAAYVDAGYAVVHVNYRGSTGYGSAWRDALTGRPGLTELEDVGAVYDALVAEGVVDPRRAILSGGSWGGFLTLLGLGTQPERWAAGIAEVPVADYLAAYEDEMEGLRAYDRALFGGSPEQVRDVYVRSSPITYVDAVAAPVLVVAGANDPRCPIRQIENYLAELDRLGTPHEVYRFDAGHGSLVVEETIRQVEVALSFALRHVTP
jgi:dipeptidyl aminopeptidase/acylaminoacyl peptidase